MTTSVLAPLSPRFENVRSIAVLRGGGLGDLLFAMPALAALQRAYPDAAITLLGTPVAAELLRGQQLPHEVVVLPSIPGVRPATAAEPEDPARRDRFVAELRQRHFDLAVQLHGGGDNSNPLLLAIGARHTVGSRTDTSAELERSIPYRIYQHEMLRGLELAGLAGAAPVALEPHLTPTPTARRKARAMLHESVEPGRRPLLVLHSGASDPRRRWPGESFAELATRAAAGGMRLRVVGAQEDAAAAEHIVRAAREADGHVDAESLVGAIALDELAAVLELADVVVGNDSGPRHLAAAVGAPTVGIFWVGNALSAAPLTRARHRVLLGWATHCPICGRDTTRVDVARCRHDPSFVAGVEVDEVAAEVADLMATNPPARGR